MKLDWLINDNHSLEYTGWTDSRTEVRTTYSWDESTDTIGANQGDTIIDRGGDNHILKYTGTFGDNFTVALLAGQSEYNLTTQSPADTSCPAAYDSRGGGLAYLGCWTNLVPEAGEDSRDI